MYIYHYVYYNNQILGLNCDLDDFVKGDSTIENHYGL